MEHRLRERVCWCVKGEKESRVEHLVKGCAETSEWRRRWGIREEEKVEEILRWRGQELVDLQKSGEHF